MKDYNKALEERVRELGDPNNTEGLALSVYREGFREGAKWAHEETAIDVLNWLNKNPLEWDLGGDVEDIIDKYFKSKRK